LRAERPPFVPDSDSAPVEVQKCLLKGQPEQVSRMGRRMVDDPAATGSGKNLELSLHGYELDLLVVRSIDSRRASGSDPYLQ